MRIATWNVNSIRSKVDLVLEYLTIQQPDVLAIQETKCTAEQFPHQVFEDAGYFTAVEGLNQWNGVAIISRMEPKEVFTLPGQPAFSKDLTQPGVHEPRSVIATFGGNNPCTVANFYVPNGREIHNPHFTYKLDFLSAISQWAGALVDSDPDVRLALMGDWNIAPFDDDVWDVGEFIGRTHVTPREREALAALDAEGFVDVTRTVGYTYWDFQKMRYQRNEGMRIDMQWASPALAAECAQVWVDREFRARRGASDHAPVMAVYE